ncbi:S-layer homology domain-containing protein [Devriesea agamarum]|uniref:S-layer homology domain-containing protein n=1 Tax=Devriesea agamarum TaxID=472569 RepID=UPI00071CAE00|nr:S-layer homology domain-containing protein [Devriesea agamarum]
MSSSFSQRPVPRRVPLQLAALGVTSLALGPATLASAAADLIPAAGPSPGNGLTPLAPVLVGTDRADVPGALHDSVPLSQGRALRPEKSGRAVPSPRSMNDLEDPVLHSLPARAVDTPDHGLVGVTWPGCPAPDRVELRSLNADGSWGRWMVAELAHGTDGQVRGTEPVWVGDATAVAVRAVRGGSDVSTELVLARIGTPVTAEDKHVTSAHTGGPGRGAASALSGFGAGTSVDTAGLASGGRSASPAPWYLAPRVISRAGWGADESMRKGEPTYAPELKAAVLHHTYGSNNYTREQSPAIIRGILRYHTQDLGWNDIGYNALVDRFGQIFEGRFGGLNRNVVGAHAKGSNTGTFGISMMGDNTTVDPTPAQLAAVADMMAWRLGGTYIFDVNTKVTIDTKSQPRIFGHRDAHSGGTACPGDAGYRALPKVRSMVSERLEKYRTSSYQAWREHGGAKTLGTVTHSAALSGGIYLTRTSEDYTIKQYPDGSAQVFASDDFTDVPLGTMFRTEIRWMRSRDISTGWDDGSYRPRAGTNRDAMAAFIYRWVGSPAFTPPQVPPFVDIHPSTQFYREMTWLKAKGISAGWPDRTYRPWSVMTREAMAAFLYRIAGAPPVSLPASSPFKDVSSTSQHYRAVVWMARTGITTGYPDGTFRPGEPVQRDAMAAFLFRYEEQGLPKRV